MTVPSRRFFPFLLVSALAFSACGSDDGTSPEDPLAPFLGTWTGVSMLFTATATGAQVDAILAGGTLTVVITQAGRFTLSLSIPPFVNQQDAGTFSVSGSAMTMATDGAPVPITGSTGRRPLRSPSRSRCS